MKNAALLSHGLTEEFQELLAHFLVEKGYLEDPKLLESSRFLSRTVLPHLQKLSALFNREKVIGPELGMEAPYWNLSQNSKNLRLAYLLGFMPCNLYRVASVWNELYSLGFTWNNPRCHAIELGSGPAAGVCGIAFAESKTPVGLPAEVYWALVEGSKSILELGSSWAQHYFKYLGFSWQTRGFHKTLDFKNKAMSILPKGSPTFDLWVMSFFINELQENESTIAEALKNSWDEHLAQEGLIVLIEPALRDQSRRMLKIREALLGKMLPDYQILLPCLGHQDCGALRQPEDWCFEEVSWWRPPFLSKLDSLSGFDHKSLAFSYTVIIKSKKDRHLLLPKLKASNLARVVSTVKKTGPDFEFYTCGQSGKKKVRLKKEAFKGLERGDILTEVQERGDTASTRIDSCSVCPRKEKI